MTLEQTNRSFTKNPKELIRIKLVVIYSLILSTIFLFMHLSAATSLFYVGICLLIFSFLCFSEKEQFLFIAFLIPNLFMYKQIGNPSAILGYFFMFLSLKYIIQHFAEIEINPYLALHFGFCCLTCLYWNDSVLFFSAFRFLFVFSFFSFLAKAIKNNDIPLVFDFFILGAVVAIIFGIIYRAKAGTLLNGMFAGIQCGRNYFTAAISPVFCIILIQLIKRKNNLIKNLFYFISTTIYFLCLILAASRTAVIALVFPCILSLSFFSLLKDDLLKIRKFLFFLLMLAFIAYFLFSQYGDSIGSLIERFFADDLKTGNNRFVLWQYYIEQTTKELETLLIGHGTVFDRLGNVEHNLLVQCFNETGLFGVFTLLGTFYYSIKKCIHSTPKICINAFMPLCVVFFCYMGINTLHADQFSFLFILSLLVIKYYSNTENIQNAN